MIRFKLIVICCLVVVAAFAKKPPTMTMYLSLPDQVVKCQVISEKIQINIKESLTYYWYAHNNVFQTQGGFDGRILHGDYKSFYLSNQLKEQGHFHKGLKNKAWTTWNDKGKIKELCTWKNGVLHGLHKVYNANGELIVEEHIRNGVLHGKQKNYENGKLKSVKVFRQGKEKTQKIKAEKVSRSVAPSDSTGAPGLELKKDPVNKNNPGSKSNDKNKRFDRSKNTGKEAPATPGTKKTESSKAPSTNTPGNTKKESGKTGKQPSAAAGKKEASKAPSSSTPEVKQKKSLGQTIKGWFKKDKTGEKKPEKK